jgi:hypothetical protein
MLQLDAILGSTQPHNEALHKCFYVLRSSLSNRIQGKMYVVHNPCEECDLTLLNKQVQPELVSAGGLEGNQRAEVCAF